MKNIKIISYHVCIGICAVLIGMTIAHIQKTMEVPKEVILPQQNVEVANLESLTKVPIPKADVLLDFTLTHLDKSTTSFKIITFSTTTQVGGYYENWNGSLSIRVYNFEKRKNIQGKEVDAPIVNISVLLHELVHMTTMYNTRGPECQYVWNSVCQEKMAYDAGYVYEQIRSFEEDGWIVLSKN